MPRYTYPAAATALVVVLLAFNSPKARADDIAPMPSAAEAAPTAPQQPTIIVTADGLPPGTRQVTTSYEGSWNGFATLDIAVAATITPKAYAVVANLTPEGLTELTSHLRKSTTYQARSSGEMTPSGATPVYYFHHGGKRGREVELKFSPKGVVTKAKPVFGNFGDPPASPAQKREAMDSLTAAITMATANSDNVCSRTLKIFDGKARYNLTLTPAGSQKISTPGYKGATLKCHAQYTRVAGYDRPKKNEKPLVEKPFTIWFAPAPNGLQIPARIKMDSNFGPISVTLQYMEATAVL
ncbi:MAG: DUF3108 domain-containing protein [Caulobacterales bacterium]